jgi:hypothetical protein
MGNRSKKLGPRVTVSVSPSSYKSVYCLRHTAICMRIILSRGQAISPTPAPAWSRLNASTPSTCRCLARW